MKFIVGIGNPGEKYKRTRHNVGFLAVDALKKSKQDPKKVSLFKPSTFVNNTGDFIRELADKKSFSPAELLIVCDDVNLPFGKLRLRGEGSAGGHHGLESVIGALDSDAFARLRIGVGREGMPKDLKGFVLEEFDKSEEKELSKILDQIVAICEDWVKGGLKPATDTLSRLQSLDNKNMRSKE